MSSNLDLIGSSQLFKEKSQVFAVVNNKSLGFVAGYLSISKRTYLLSFDEPRCLKFNMFEVATYAPRNPRIALDLHKSVCMHNL